MARIRVELESVQVTEGQGIGEGDFELRVRVKEGNNDITWPALNSSSKVDKGGVPLSIGKAIGIYTVTEPLGKRFTIDVTEVDKGTLGQDDQGQATLNFDLTPTMSPTTQSAIISLKRPNMNFNGKVKVTLTAQQA